MLFFKKTLDFEGFLNFGSMKGRLVSLVMFFTTLFSLPFVLVGHLLKTFFKVVGVFFGILALALCLGVSEGVRCFFITRLVLLAQDIGDWIVFPFTVIMDLLKTLGGFLIHPALYFKSY